VTANFFLQEEGFNGRFVLREDISCHGGGGPQNVRGGTGGGEEGKKI